MARAHFRSNSPATVKKKKRDRKVLILSILNTALTVVILLKLYGVI